MTLRQPPPAWSKDSVMLRLPSAMTLADLSESWAFGGATGAGVRVAVIDSGIDADHPALDGCVDADGGMTFTVEKDERVVATQGPHGDSFGHGTACAGIIHRIAPEAELFSVRVLGDNMRGRAVTFAAGLDWAINNGFQVINMSLSTSSENYQKLFYELADDAYFKNVVLVAAVNNIPAPSYPSTFSAVVSVAAHHERDPWTYYYNPTPPVEFGAAGIDIEVAWINKQYAVNTGNSFAAPHITGLVALILSKHPGLTPFQVKTMLMAGARNLRKEE